MIGTIEEEDDSKEESYREYEDWIVERLRDQGHGGGKGISCRRYMVTDEVQVIDFCA